MRCLLFLVVALLLVGLTGCGKGPTSPPPKMDRMDRIERALEKHVTDSAKYTSDAAADAERIRRILSDLSTRTVNVEKALPEFIKRDDLLDKKTGKIKAELLTVVASAWSSDPAPAVLPKALPATPKGGGVAKVMPAADGSSDEGDKKFPSKKAPCSDVLHMLPDGTEVWLPEGAIISTPWWRWCRDGSKEYTVNFRDAKGKPGQLKFVR